MTKLSYVSLAGLFVLGSVSYGQQFQATDAHELLKKDVGTWNCAIKLWAGAEEPVESKGTEVNKMLGDLWVVSDFEGKFFGQDFSGKATVGYDPVAKKYTGTWIDSMTPHIMTMSGTYNKETKTLTMMTKGMDPSGAEMLGKNETFYKDKDTRVFTMYGKQGEKYAKMMEITYTRKKK